MAVTKTHPIKSTLKAAINYICNPEKTDGKLLVSSYGCAAETADIEFAWTRRHAIDKGTNLGRHLIQAFQPGEVTPEEAHRIGMELAKEILGGKYEFVLTTHIDKNHVHNHLIFNAVSFADHKHYHSNKRSYHYIRRTSDRLCKEHGLSVIIPGQDKGKSYIEHKGTTVNSATFKLVPISRETFWGDAGSCTLDYLSEGYIQWTITVPGAVIVSFEGNLHFNKLGTPFGTFDHAISAYGTIGTEDVKYGLSKGKWEVEFTGIATAANGDMYSVVDGATLAFSVTK